MRACWYVRSFAVTVGDSKALSQTRFFCSSLVSWREKDGAFSFKQFYYYIVALFEMDLDSAWVAETLDWWDK